MRLLLTSFLLFSATGFAADLPYPFEVKVTQINVHYHAHFTNCEFMALRDCLSRQERFQGPGGNKTRFKSTPEVLSRLASEILKTKLFVEEQYAKFEMNSEGVYRIILTLANGNQVERMLKFEDKKTYPDVAAWLEDFGMKDPLAVADPSKAP